MIGAYRRDTFSQFQIKCNDWQVQTLVQGGLQHMRRNDDPIYLILPKHRQVFLFPDAIADGIAEEDSISLLIEFSFDALNDLCKKRM